ncbi:hypothetical protein D3C75_1324460 [compost metagenome]
MVRQKVEGAPLIRPALHDHRSRLGKCIVGEDNNRIGRIRAADIILTAGSFTPDS